MSFEKVMRSIIRQVADALVYLHERGIVHGNIKPSSILVKGQTIKVANFGMSKFRFDINWRSENYLYSAPESEIHLSWNPLEFKIDVWSLGVVICYYIFGERFLQSKYNEYSGKLNIAALLKEHISSKYEHSADFTNLLTKMLIKDAESRYSMHDVKYHQFLNPCMSCPEKNFCLQFLGVCVLILLVVLLFALLFL